MDLDPTVWGPHYWFVLHTISLCYPLSPNDVTKKKYYEFIHNLPLMIPVEKIGNRFGKLIDQYPVTPYLDSRESFQKWMHFIHNKINEMIDLPIVTFPEFIDKYYHHYKPKDMIQREKLRKKEIFIFSLSILVLIGFIGFIYKK